MTAEPYDTFIKLRERLNKDGATEELVNQAEYILKELDCIPMTKEELINLTKNNKNAEEFLQYPKVVKIPDIPETYAQMPIPNVERWKIESDAPTNFNQLGGN